MAEDPPKVKISLKELLTNIIPDLDSPFIIFLFFFFIGLVALIVLWRFAKGASLRRAVALIGLCESGKTLMFSKLCFGKEIVTVTSISKSSASCSFEGNKKVLLHDLPGHDRIRYSMLDKVKNQLKAFIFVIDSSSFQKDIKDVAQFLYYILCDSAIQGGIKNILVACNKQDLPTAKGASLIQTSLEREMNLLRVTQSSQLRSVGESGNNNTFLGKRGQDFEFSHLTNMKVKFMETVSSGESNLDQIKTWISQFA